MPIYEYKGQQYDITTEDPAEAKAKILGYLEKQPSAPMPKVPDFAGNPALSPQEQVYAAATPSGIATLRKPSAVPELTEYNPTFSEMLMGLIPGDKAKAANEYAARKAAEERGVSTEEIYKGAGGARPMFNPEGREPILAGAQAGKVIAKELPNIPQQTVVAGLQAIRAGDIGAPGEETFLDKSINYMTPETPKGAQDKNYDAFQGLSKSMGFSLASMVSSIVGSAAGASVAGPFGAVATGMGASGTVAYRASKDDFLSRVRDKLNQESIKLYNKPIGKADWENAKKEFDDAASSYGAWEAVPEALSNAIMLKAFTGPARAAAGAGRLEQFMVKNNVVEKAASFVTEHITETATGLGQNAAELRAGLTKEEMNIADAFRQQFVQTFLMAGGMQAGAKATKAASQFYQDKIEPRVNPESALGRAIMADLNAVEFSQSAINREAVARLNPNNYQTQPVVAEKIAETARGIVMAPPPPEEPLAALPPPTGIAGLTAAPSESMDTEAMLREALGQPPATTLPPVNVETQNVAFDPAGWTQKENKINEKTGEPIYQPGTMVFEKTDEAGTHRVVTRNDAISQSITNSPVIEIINSYLTSDEDNGKISGKIQIDNKTGKLIFVEDGERGQVIKMSPRAEQQYKEGVPLEKIAETEFSDAGGIRPDGTRTPHTTTAAFKAKKTPAVIPAAQQPKTPTDIQPTVAEAGPFVRKQMEAQAPTTPTPLSIEGALSGIETPKAKQAEAQGEQTPATPSEKLTLDNLKDRPIEEQYTIINTVSFNAKKALREGRINQEQMDKIEAEKNRITQEIGKKTLSNPTPDQKQALDLADQIDAAGQKDFADIVRKSVTSGFFRKDSIPFYQEKLQEFQAQQGKTEAKEEGFKWSEFLQPNEQKYYDTFQKTASPEAKVAFDKVESSIQDVTKALNNLGYQVNDKKFPIGLGNLKTQYSNLLSDGLKLLRDHYAIQKEYKRADADKFDLSIKRANDSAAQAQQVIRKAIPRPQEITEAEQRVSEGEKAVSRIKGKPGRSLWTALTGKLGSSDVAELFGKSLQIYQKKLQAKKDSSGKSIADMVSDGDLDDFLPFQMRSNVPGFDGQEAEEYIKEQVRGQNYIPYDSQVEIEQIFGSVEEAEKLINDYLTTEEQNLELQEAADEERQGEINARSVEPESEIPSTEPDEGEALTKPTPEGLRAKEKYRIESEAKEAAEARANKEAGDRAKADKEVGEFTLTGSDRATDVAAAQGQKDIFDQKEEEPKTNNPAILGEEFPEIGADVFASIDASNKEIRDAISKSYKAGDLDEAMNILENMPRNKAAFETPEEDGVKVVPFEADSETVGKLLSETREEEEPSDIRRNALMHSTEKPAKPKPTEMLTPEEAKAQIDEWKAEAARQGKTNKNYNKTILSLFDASGEWAKPWYEAGYDVHTFDIQTGEDINDFNAEYLLENGYGDLNIWGILAAPPCTDFASSGAQFWAKKDVKGQTEISNELVMQVIRTVNFLQPKIWALENPVGRIAKLNNLPPAHLTFDPNFYGDPYTKKTLLWGNFENNLPMAPVEPTEGSKIQKISGKNKFARSLTPEGFAYAFFMANNAESMTPAERLTRTYYGVDPKAFEGATEADEEAIDSSLFQDNYYDGELDEAADIARNIIGGQQEIQKELPSEDYQKAMDESNKAIKAFNKIQEAYRAQKIGDDEFLAGRKVYDAAIKKFDEAYAEEQEEAKPEPVKTPEGGTMRYPMASVLFNDGYEVLPLKDPRTYVDKGGKAHRTFEKDGVRVSLTPQLVLFQNKNAVLTGQGESTDLVINALLVDQAKRNQGKANEALQNIVDAADQYGVTLYIEPVPLVNLKEKDFGLDSQQLEDLYKKFGFDFAEDSNKVMVREPEVEVLGPAEKPAVPRLTNEPYTIEGDFTEIGEEKQHALLSDQTSKLSEDQNKSLESQYGAKRDSTEFLDSLRKDVIAFITEGAKAVNGKIRAIIRQIANGVLSVAIVFNPQFVSKPYTIAVPQYDIKTSEVIKDLPKEAQSMSDAAKRAYGVIYPALEKQLKEKDKLFIVADKRSGNTYLFNPDGSLLLQSKTLFGKAIGDYMHGDNEIEANRITPAGVFDLGLRDAKRSAGEAYTAGDYDFGKVFVLDKSHMGSNGPYSNTIMHSVWTNETDAKQRLAALDKPGAEDSRYSFGCINVNKETFKYLITNHLNQMDGAKIFIVPENGANVMDFINGKAMNSDDIIRQKVEPVTKTTVTEKKVPAPKPEVERKQTGRETELAKLEVKTEEEAPGKEPKEPKEQTFYSVEGKKLPPGRSPELAAAAKEVKAGRMSAAEFDKLVNKYKPIYLYQVPLKPATTEQMAEALSSDKKEKINPTISNGTRVGLRLDIPAFNRKGVYVVSIHEKGNKSGPGKVVGYDSVAVINNVTFGLGSQTKALDIATGASKDALQTMEGEYVKTDPSTAYVNAVEAMNDPAWTQIAVDPVRHAYFYDRNTTQPVIAAEQVIQIGNMVLAKNVTYGDKADYLYNIGKEGYANEEQKKRSDSLKRTIKTLNRMRKDGRITDEQFVERADAAIAADEEQRLEEEPNERKRGFLHIQKRLNEAVLAGDMSREARDLATWFMVNNEDLVSDLGVSIIGKGKAGQGGQYNAYKRIMTVIKNGVSDLTTVHEILHHLERMMPTKIQQAIRKAWSSQLAKAAKAAKTPNEKLYFAALMDAHYGDGNIANIEVPKGAEKTYEQIKSLLEALQKRGSSEDFAMEMLKLGMVPTASYEYFNPSEFWAVNGSDIVKARFDAVRGGMLARLKNWLKEFAQKIKSLFGLKSDASIIRALDSLAKSDGKFVTREMLGEGYYLSIQNYKGNAAPTALWGTVDPSFTDGLIYQGADKQIDTKRVIERINSTIGQIDERLDAYTKETLYHGRSATRIMDFLEDDFSPLLERMKKEGVTIDALEKYLHNRHAEERNEQINKINLSPDVQDTGSGIETSVAQAYLANLPAAERIKLARFAAEIDTIIIDTQQILVDGGLETQDTIDQWGKTYKHYVPLQRDDLDFVHTGSGYVGGVGTKGGASKRAVGSVKPVKDILNNIAMQREQAIRRAEQAKVGRALYALAITSPNPKFWLPVNPRAIKNKAKLIQEMVSLGLTIQDAENLIRPLQTPSIDKTTGLVRYDVNPAQYNSKNVFPVRINGEDRFIIFNPKDERALRMAMSLKNMDSDQLGFVLGNIGAVTRWIASINTQYNPVFGAWNMTRDVQSAAFNLSTTEIAGKEKEVLKVTLPAIFAIWKSLRNKPASSPKEQALMDLFDQMRLAGGTTGFAQQFSGQGESLESFVERMRTGAPKEKVNIVEQEMKRLNRGNVRKAAQGIFNWLSDYNDAMENAVRLSAFKVALEQGLSEQKAASIAKELTVNFNRKGASSPTFQALYAFINASVQGTSRLIKTLNGPMGKKIIAGGITLGVIQAIALALNGYDDEDPPEFLKNKNFIIPIPFAGNNYIILPMPPGLNVFPGIGRIITETVLIKGGLLKSNQGIGNKALGVGSLILDSFNPLGAGSFTQMIAPTAFDPLFAIAANKDAFGRPIYKKDMATQPTPGYERSRPTATFISQGIAEFLNFITSPIGTKYTKGLISPTADEIDYLAGQYFGGISREVIKGVGSIKAASEGAPVPAYKIPIVGKLYGETKTPASISAKFYDNISQMSEYEHEIKKLIQNKESVEEYKKANPESKLWQQANNVENIISKLNKEKKIYLEKKDTKNAQRIEDMRVKAMRDFNDKVRAAQ